MALILAIESDKRQVNYLTAMVRGKLHAELVLGDTAEGALDRLGDRVPDLILTSALLSPKDEQALGDRLRRLNGVAAHVQMLTLPVFAPPSRSSAPARGGMLSALLGDRSQAAAPEGCDPAVFAEQCKEYLQRASEERESRRHDDPVEIAPTDAAPDTSSDQDEITVDVDLSNLLDPETTASARSAAAADEEPAIYELSADAIELDGRLDLAAPVAAPADDTPAAEPPPAEEEFDDWQNVIDALKRESAQVRVPRERKPDPRKVQAAAPAPQSAAPQPPPPPASPSAASKIAAEPPRRRLRAAADEWGMFDPTQAGMAALYERLEQLTQDDERR